MKKLILTTMALATLASCQKESLVDSAITQTGDAIRYSAYSQLTSTKGAPVDSNTEFQGDTSGFYVAAYKTDDSATQYLGFKTVTYDNGAWGYSDNATYYWPSESVLTFAAFYPTSAYSASAPAYSSAGYTFGHTPSATTTEHVDVMFAFNKEVAKCSAVPLHFKHALTQINFQAAVDESMGIAVTLKSIEICNVKPTGAFTIEDNDDLATSVESDGTVESENVELTAGSWATSGDHTNYTAHPDGDNLTNDALVLTSSYVAFSDVENPLMLIPQELTAWTPTNLTADVDSFTDCYLKIGCKITHSGDNSSIVIVDGYVYIPFDSKDEAGTTEIWKAGNKLTYKLLFGGGYPYEPGTTPDDDEGDEDPDVDESIPTLLPITYTVTVDEWKDVAADGIEIEDDEYTEET